MRVERESLADHRKQNNTTWPQVNFTTVASLMKDFWSDVSWCATSIENQFCRGSESWKSEVCDLDLELWIAISFNKYILWLEVSVNDTALVDVSDTQDQLAHYFDHICFRNDILLQIALKLASMYLFHYDPHPSWILVNFTEWSHIRMVQQRHNLDLISQKLFLLGWQFSFINFLESIRFLCLSVGSLNNIRKLAAAKSMLLNVELFHVIELTVVLELLEPLINDLLVFMEKHLATECLTIVKQIKAEHIIFVLYFLEIKSF